MMRTRTLPSAARGLGASTSFRPPYPVNDSARMALIIAELMVFSFPCWAKWAAIDGGKVQVGVDRLRDGSAHAAYKSVSRHRIGYERQGCSRAIDVVLHRGRPAYPDRPTTSPFSLTGNPPPHAAIRARVGMPAKSDGSPWIKLKKSCVETPNRAVYALFCAISMVGIGAPSIRVRLPPSSRIATFSVTPSSLAFSTASSTIFCASSEEMLCFF